MEANNMAAMREALLALKELDFNKEDCHAFYRIIDESLAKPPRQCDVGTAEEQKQRFKDFCKEGKLGHIDLGAYCAYDCPCGRSYDCKLKWAQMPYEEGGTK